MSDNRSQGRKANDAGQSADNTVRVHLTTHAALIGCDVRSIRAYQEVALGGLFGGRGDFAEDVRVCDDAAFGRPFVAHYALRHRDWPEPQQRPLLLFVHSQDDSGTAENAVLRFLWNLSYHRRLPGVILLLGEHWERPDACAAVEWIRDRCRGRREGACLLRVFLGLAEFRAWIAEGMPWPEVRQQSFA